MIYVERSDWRKSHYSSKPKAELKNALLSLKAEPELKTYCYFALMSYVTILFTK